MVSGLEGWLFGYAGTKLADQVLELLRGNKLTADLHKATQKWVAQLPENASLASAYALFPTHIPDYDLIERPYLASIRSMLRTSKLPTYDDWCRALIEQWRYVKARVNDPQDFFLLSEKTALSHLESLAISLCTVCYQHEPLFRATTISLLIEIREQVGNSNKCQKSFVDVLTEDQKKLLRRLYQYEGLCRIAPAKGEYECLWVPGAICDMQWGWERIPNEYSVPKKELGDRQRRLNWIYVVKDLTDAGIFEAQADGYFELTESGRRVAHDLCKNDDDPIF